MTMWDLISESSVKNRVLFPALSVENRGQKMSDEDRRRRTWRAFCEGRELHDLISFNVSIKEDGSPSTVQISRRDHRMRGARIREDYILDRVEPGELTEDKRRVMHMHLLPNHSPDIAYDPHRLLKTDFKRGKL